MSKVVTIDYCGDCPKRFYEHNDMHCELTDLKTHENNPIPDWCPLSSVEEMAREIQEQAQAGASISDIMTLLET